MQTECPFCHVEVEIDQEKIGEKWQCPNCGEELLIEEEIVVEEDAGNGIITECPACNRRFEVGAKDIEQATVCPFCQNDFTIFPVEDDPEDVEDAGVGFLTACPNCRNQFEVGAKDIGELAVCPICNHEFIISGKKRRPWLKVALIIAAAVAVIAAAIVGYVEVNYYCFANEKRALENFTEVVTQSFLSRGGQLTPENRKRIEQEVAQNYIYITEKGWQAQFIELFCDKEFALFCEDIKRKKADKNYKPTPADIAKEKKFWAYFRYKYSYANPLLRRINIVTNKLLGENAAPQEPAEK